MSRFIGPNAGLLGVITDALCDMDIAGHGQHPDYSSVCRCSKGCTSTPGFWLHIAQLIAPAVEAYIAAGPQYVSVPSEAGDFLGDLEEPEFDVVTRHA